MQPKTVEQKNVVELSYKVKKLTPKQKEWAIKKCFEHNVYISRKTLYCTTCGYSWKDDKLNLSDENLKCKCPSCKRKLKVINNRGKQVMCVAYLDTIQNYQVIRYFYVHKYFPHKLGDKATYFDVEVMRHFVDSKGKVHIMTLLRQPFGRYIDSFIYTSELEIRPYKLTHESFVCIVPWFIYPKQKILPEIKRNGFIGDTYDICPTLLFHNILSDMTYEMFIKNKQIHLLEKYTKKHSEYLQSIKVCIRHNYIIDDLTMWYDYIKMIDNAGKDILNPKYICPVDLKHEHDKYLEKARKKRLKEKIKQLSIEIEENQVSYEKDKSKYFGIVIQNNNIRIEPLRHVKEFLTHGDILHHCIFESEYYKKQDSLLMSAYVDNNPVETVEIDIKSFQIKQARGLFNQPSAYNKDIIELLNQNMNIIKKYRNGKRQKETYNC